MRRVIVIGLFLLLVLAACNGPQREARQMVRRAERLFDTDPDSTVRLIDSVLRIPAYFEEGKRMDIAMLQAEALFGDRDDREISPLMDDEFFDDKPFLTTSPELERAADYYARKKKYDKAAHAALYSGYGYVSMILVGVSMQNSRICCFCHSVRSTIGRKAWVSVWPSARR